LRVIGPVALQTFRMEVPGGLAAAALIPSCSCGVTDLADLYEVPGAVRRELACGAGWQARWEASRRRGGVVAGCPVSDLGKVLAVVLDALADLGRVVRAGRVPAAVRTLGRRRAADRR
jgi:hypothetical protein